MSYLETQLKDTVKAQFMQADGSYEKLDRRGKEAMIAQDEFCKEYMARSQSQKKEASMARTFKPETHIE